MHRHPFPVAQAEVYLNDFIGLAHMAANETKVQCHMMYNINDMFCTNGPQQTCNEPISDKKLATSTAAWSTQQSILGWEVDMLAQTLRLPAHQLEQLTQLLTMFPHCRKSVPICKWQRVLRELKSMVAGIPGGHSLFSALQWELK